MSAFAFAFALLWVGVATANTAPLADAGLDQEAQNGTTVYLDGAGSTDPDGSIAAYEWTITAPDGSTATPECRTCGQTNFVPNATGQCNVTLAVTDGDGATREDTLYITVEAADPPTASVSGPEAVYAGATATYTVDASADGATLSTVVWQVDDIHRASRKLSGDSATDTMNLSLAAGRHTVSATVIDRDGQRQTDEQAAVAVVDGSGGGGRSGVSAGGGASAVSGASAGAGGGGGDGPAVTYDALGRGEIQINHDNIDVSDGAFTVDGVSIGRMELQSMDGERLVERLDRRGVSKEELVATAVEQNPADSTEDCGAFGDTSCGLKTQRDYSSPDNPESYYPPSDSPDSDSSSDSGDSSSSGSSYTQRNTPSRSGPGDEYNPSSTSDSSDRVQIIDNTDGNSEVAETVNDAATTVRNTISNLFGGGGSNQLNDDESGVDRSNIPTRSESRSNDDGGSSGGDGDGGDSSSGGSSGGDGGDSGGGGGRDAPSRSSNSNYGDYGYGF
jgi:hypothetical protein